ncbi:ABC-2 family transporter protein [Paenibacillus sp. S150]|uniref:ABC transporter permease n=1 Tax=Paenibacillus sp. S150 TaxID=2749826 RepID=UPI001C55EEBC|nr:ABC-2 family transporter protein [Paenibacillus sp. S150]MBW4080395.1 ABC-2 family transporter protein [Paenibacillus sp. S150]
MAFYFSFFVNTFKVTFSYRSNSILKMINRLIFMIVQIEIWKIVYGYDFAKKISTDYGLITLNDMIAYTVVSHFIFIVVQTTSLKSVNDKINSGDIALYLIRPYSFLTYTFTETVAASLVSCVIQGFPLLLFGILFFHLRVDSLVTLVFFLMALLDGFVIFFLLSFLCSIIAFWVVQTGPIDTILSGIIKIFSGAWIPLWFFSPFFLKLSDALPFKTIYFAPLSIFTRKMSSLGIRETFITQWVWMVVLFILVRAVWFFGQKKLVVQGG